MPLLTRKWDLQHSINLAPRFNAVVRPECDRGFRVCNLAPYFILCWFLPWAYTHSPKFDQALYQVSTGQPDLSPYTLKTKSLKNPTPGSLECCQGCQGFPRCQYNTCTFSNYNPLSSVSLLTLRCYYRIITKNHKLQVTSVTSSPCYGFLLTARLVRFTPFFLLPYPTSGIGSPPFELFFLDN